MVPTTAIFECLTICKVFIPTIPLHMREIPTTEKWSKEKLNQPPMSHKENLRHSNEDFLQHFYAYDRYLKRRIERAVGRNEHLGNHTSIYHFAMMATTTLR